MMKPAYVSGLPNACANAGARVFTGSDAKPTAVTISSDPSSAGRALTSFRLSRSRESARATGRRAAGWTTSTPTTSARYDAEFTANDAAMPSCCTVIAASSGPIARATLYVIEFSATAEPSSSLGTSPPMSENAAGVANAVATPSPTANSITSQTRASPAHVSSASVPVSANATICVASSSFFRSNRSAALPVQGASSSTGTKFENASTPRSNGECVSR